MQILKVRFLPCFYACLKCLDKNQLLKLDSYLACMHVSNAWTRTSCQNSIPTLPVCMCQMLGQELAARTRFLPCLYACLKCLDKKQLLELDSYLACMHVSNAWTRTSCQNSIPTLLVCMCQMLGLELAARTRFLPCLYACLKCLDQNQLLELNSYLMHVSNAWTRTSCQNSIPTLLICMCQMLGQELAARTRFLPCLYACLKCLDKKQLLELNSYLACMHVSNAWTRSSCQNSIPTLLVCMCQILGQELAARTRFLPCLYACVKCLDQNQLLELDSYLACMHVSNAWTRTSCQNSIPTLLVCMCQMLGLELAARTRFLPCLYACLKCLDQNQLLELNSYLMHVSNAWTRTSCQNSIPTLLVCMCQMLGQELAARTRFLPCLYACVKCLDKKQLLELDSYLACMHVPNAWTRTSCQNSIPTLLVCMCVKCLDKNQLLELNSYLACMHVCQMLGQQLAARTQFLPCLYAYLKCLDKKQLLELDSYLACMHVSNAWTRTSCQNSIPTLLVCMCQMLGQELAARTQFLPCLYACVSNAWTTTTCQNSIPTLLVCISQMLGQEVAARTRFLPCLYACVKCLDKNQLLELNSYLACMHVPNAWTRSSCQNSIPTLLVCMSQMLGQEVAARTRFLPCLYACVKCLDKNQLLELNSYLACMHVPNAWTRTSCQNSIPTLLVCMCVKCLDQNQLLELNSYLACMRVSNAWTRTSCQNSIPTLLVCMCVKCLDQNQLLDLDERCQVKILEL